MNMHCRCDMRCHLLQTLALEHREVIAVDNGNVDASLREGAQIGRAHV